jgi:hypothetical protein
MMHRRNQDFIAQCLTATNVGRNQRVYLVGPRGFLGLSISLETIGIILRSKRAAAIRTDGLGKSMMHHKI